MLQAVAGLSRKQLAALQGSAPPAAASRPDRSSGAGRDNSLLCSLPVAVLADPSPSRPQAGIELSCGSPAGGSPLHRPGGAQVAACACQTQCEGTAAGDQGGLGQTGWGGGGEGKGMEEVMSRLLRQECGFCG